MKTIINAKAEPILKEAIRLVAKDESVNKNVSSSSLIVSILESDPRIAAKLKLLTTS